MKKEIKSQIAKWLMRGNTGISSEAILYTYMLGNTDWITRSNPYPHDNGDFNRCYLLIKDCPDTFKAIKKLAKKYQQWKNILRFWDELVYIFENGNENNTNTNKNFFNFIQAVNNIKYGNTNYQKTYNDRQKLGQEIYKKYGFSGKRLPRPPLSD